MPRLVLLIILLFVLGILIRNAMNMPLPENRIASVEDSGVLQQKPGGSETSSKSSTGAISVPVEADRAEENRPAFETLVTSSKDSVPVPERRMSANPWIATASVDIPLPIRDPRRHALGDYTVTDWSAEEVATALEFCKNAFKNIRVEFDPEPPVRKGSCGTPAPVNLRSLGDKPKVEINPAAIMNCKMAKTLYIWLNEKVQPLAKKLLNTSVVGIRNLSSYSCRNQYNNPARRISEHAFANALDIGSFIMADGTIVSVLKDWGPTEREKQAVLAKMQEEARKLQAQMEEKLAREKAEKKTPDKTGALPLPEKKDGKNEAGGQSDNKKNTAHVPLPVRKDTLVTGSVLDKKSEFLHKIHQYACKMFGTVLGPEANNAHRNHFHLDMAPRRNGSFCE